MHGRRCFAVPADQRTRGVERQHDYAVAHIPDAVFYILQGIYYLKSGNFLRTKQVLAEVIDEKDREIFEICLNRNNISGIDLIEIERLYSILISWSRDNIKIYT